MDWMEQEQERGITITSAATTCQLERPPHQHHRHPGPRRLHRRGGALAARARRRRRGLRRGRRRRAAERDGVAPGRPLQRAAHRFVNKMDRVGAEFHRCVDMIVDRLDATPLVVQLPWGVEADFKGVIDLVDMKGLLWHDRGQGRQVRGRRRSRRPRRRRRASGASSCSRPSPRTTTSSWRCTSRARSPTVDELQGRHPPGDHRRQAQPGAVRLGVQEQGRAAHARRGRRLPAEPARRRRDHRATRSSDEDEVDRARAPTRTSRSRRWRSRS